MYYRIRLGLFNLVRKMDFCLFAHPVFAYCFILNRECYTSVQNVNLNYIGSTCNQFCLKKTKNKPKSNLHRLKIFMHFE